jgi:hypothetical protein
VGQSISAFSMIYIKDSVGIVVDNLASWAPENPMRSAVFCVAVLLSVTSGSFAQNAQPSASPAPGGLTPTPTPNPSPTPSPGLKPEPSPAPSTQASSEESPKAWPEPGRYHPCPASVGFSPGRSVCLGLDEPRRHVRHMHVARWSGCWCWPCRNSYSNWAY